MEDDYKDEQHTLRRPIRAPFVWSPDEDEAKVLDRLIQNEPELTRMVANQKAWGLVTSSLVKIAMGLSALSGGFFVLRELLKGMAK